MARIKGYGLAALLFAFVLALWLARPASANCAETPTDPMCMSTAPSPASPDMTPAPKLRSTPTPAPVNRSTPPRTPSSPTRTQTYTPPVPEGTDFATPIATPLENPSIATNGETVPIGGGTASATDPPPTPGSSGSVPPWVPLGVAGIGVALAAAPPRRQAAPPPPPPAPPPTPAPPVSAVPTGLGATSDWYVYQSGLDNHFSVAKLWEGGTMQIPGVKIVFGPNTFADCWAFVAANAVDSGPIFHAPGDPPLA